MTRGDAGAFEGLYRLRRQFLLSGWRHQGQTNMRTNFTMAVTGEPPLGDYLLFKITDGTEKMQSRISFTALAILDQDFGGDYARVFEANRERIRPAVSAKLRDTPAGEAVALNPTDF